MFLKLFKLPLDGSTNFKTRKALTSPFYYYYFKEIQRAAFQISVFNLESIISIQPLRKIYSGKSVTIFNIKNQIKFMF